jgi:hypothetical protein
MNLRCINVPEYYGSRLEGQPSNQRPGWQQLPQGVRHWEAGQWRLYYLLQPAMEPGLTQM